MSFVEIFYVVLSYCIGAIPFGLLVSRGSGINIREQGSKNIGATNVARLLGKKMGLLALCGDVLKGFLPIFVMALLMEGKANANMVIALCGAATVVGHMFPVYLGFKGGKGVATALGVFLFLSPLAILGCLLVFIAAVYFSGFVSLGSLLGSASIVGLLLILGAATWKVLLASFIVILIWGKHYQNIGRLLSGTEKVGKKRANKNMTRSKWATIERARDILRLGDDATLAEIKRAYHRLSKRYHPDSVQGKGQGDTDKMYQLTAAYEQLMQYCAEYRFPLTPSGKEELDQYDPEEWWQERFGEDPLWGKGGRRRK